MKIKKGDTVLIISGKDRGKKGAVSQVFPKTAKVMVEGVNLKKKHRKPKKSGEKGQVINLPAALPVSNTELVCPKCGKPTRVGYKVVDKKKYRICKKCGEQV
ncbi:MAG: 50S ribosomal protein L24 [bacterium]|nr:50S ribosomal protein L24 [bacterium]